MSQKPVCVKCACYYRMAKSGVWYVEMAPRGGNFAPRGNRDPGAWEPYKIWHADLWGCPDCGHTIIAGSGIAAVYERHFPEFNTAYERLMKEGRIVVLVNDC